MSFDQNFDGSIVLQSPINNLKTYGTITKKQGAGYYLTTAGMVGTEIILLLNSMPLFTVLGSVAAIISSMLLSIPFNYKFAAVKSLMEQGDYKVVFKNPDLLKLLFGIRKDPLLLAKGFYKDNSIPSEFRGSGEFARSYWDDDDDYDPINGRDYQYEYELYAIKTKNGLELKQTFIPLPITMWDHGFIESKMLHKISV